MELSFTKMGRTRRGAGFRGDETFSSKHIKLEMLIKCPSGDVK